MKRKQTGILLVAIIAVLQLTCPVHGASDNVAEAAKILAKGLSARLSVSRLKVTLGKLTKRNSDVSSEFADHFLIYLESELKKNVQDFKEVARKGTMRTRGFKVHDNETPKASQPMIETTLEGDYRIVGDSVFVSVFLTDANGRKISEHEVEISRSAIHWPLEPENVKIAQAAETEIKTVINHQNDFRIALMIDRGNGAVYKEGEEVKVYFETEEACYLNVLYLTADGQRIIMYPTDRDPQTPLQPGLTHELHRNNRYTVMPPFGQERIVAFCSTAPVQDTGSRYLGGGFHGFNANIPTSSIVGSMRGLAVSGRTARRAETTVFMITAP